MIFSKREHFRVCKEGEGVCRKKGLVRNHEERERERVKYTFARNAPVILGYYEEGVSSLLPEY